MVARCRMVVYATPLYLEDGYFVWKNEMVRRIAKILKGDEGVCLVISFELLSERMSDRAASRIISLASQFAKVVIEYARNIEWGGYRQPIERAGIEMYDNAAPASASM